MQLSPCFAKDLISRCRACGDTIVSVAIFIAVANGVENQAAAQSEQYQTWTAATLTGPVSGDLFTHSDLHYRIYDDGSPSTLLVRPGLSVRVADGMFLTLGYLWQPFWRTRGTDDFVNEQRIWQQWMWDITLAPALKLNLRSRLEQRFREQYAFEVGFRFRQQIRVMYAMDERFVWIVGNEIFVALHDTAWPSGQATGFDQNRVFLALGVVVVPGSLRVDVGYINIYVRRPSPPGDTMIHALQVTTNAMF